MKLVNRSVLIIRPKKPFADWAQSVKQEEPLYSLERHRRDCTAFLVAEIESDDDEEKIVQTVYQQIFEHELSSWITDESAWPKKRDLLLFQEWFDVEFSSIVVDLEKGEIKTGEFKL